MYIMVCGGGTFWFHRATLTFKDPAAYQATAVYQIGVNKIPPNFDTLFTTSLESLQLFKRFTARLHISFGVKGLILIRNGLNMTYSCTLK
jgi:glucose uptake protein GlcU